jgi:hypothetical protein
VSVHSCTGAELSRGFFDDLVRPLLLAHLPGESFAAGRLGAGSDVLGLDDEVSRDHDWGLRLSVFVAQEDQIDATVRLLDNELPTAFRGLPIRFAFTGETAARHHVEVQTVSGFLSATIGVDRSDRLTTSDWLSITGQAALEVTAGPVFYDGSGELGRARDALAWYPEDLWRYVIACDWARLSQEMPFLGRAAYVGDEAGSRVIGARLAQIIMHLTFLLERHWPPYSKWFGTLWGALADAGELRPFLEAMLSGADHAARQAGMAAALEVLLARQNRLGLSEAAHATVPFWDRPYLHPAPEITDQLLAGIVNEEVRALPLGLGSIEQRTDNVDLLVSPQLRRQFIRDRS